MFSQVSVFPHGGCLPMIPGRGVSATLPQEDTPPSLLPPWADTPRQTLPLGRHPPPLGRHPLDIPPPGRHPTGQTPPWADSHPQDRNPWADTPPPPPQPDTTGYGQQADGTHPTGMHSCLILCKHVLISLVCPKTNFVVISRLFVSIFP